MSPASERIVAVVAAYEAARTVADVVRGIAPHVESVLVVDDGSRDGTSEAARSAGARVHRLETNSGKGTALAEAFAILRMEDVDGALTLDADGQHLPGEAARLFACDADLVLGVRDHLFEGMSPLRRASNRLSSGAIAWLAGVATRDVQTGFRLYRKRLFEPGVLRPGRFESESAVLVRAHRLGLRIECQPIQLAVVDGRETSHYRAVADSLRIGLAVLRARFEPLPT